MFRQYCNKEPFKRLGRQSSAEFICLVFICILNTTCIFLMAIFKQKNICWPGLNASWHLNTQQIFWSFLSICFPFAHTGYQNTYSDCSSVSPQSWMRLQPHSPFPNQPPKPNAGCQVLAPLPMWLFSTWFPFTRVLFTSSCGIRHRHA